MANETKITVVGNLTADPELRYTSNGLAVANFTIASTPRVYDKQAGAWQDGEPLFLRGAVWRDYAEHVASSLAKGMQVIAVGNLRQRSYETKEGDKRTSFELDVEEIGPALRFATAQVARAGRSSSASGGWPQEASTGRGAHVSQGQGAGASQAANAGGWEAVQPADAFVDEPPF